MMYHLGLCDKSVDNFSCLIARESYWKTKSVEMTFHKGRCENSCKTLHMVNVQSCHISLIFYLENPPNSRPQNLVALGLSAPA